MTQHERDNLEADLSAYLDGELDHDRAQAIEQLLAESSSARTKLEGLREVARQLASLPRHAAPETVAETVATRAGQRLEKRRAQARGRLRVIRLWTRFGAAAAVLLACAFIGYRMFKPTASIAPAAAPSSDLSTWTDEELVRADPRAQAFGEDQRSAGRRRGLTDELRHKASTKADADGYLPFDVDSSSVATEIGDAKTPAVCLKPEPGAEQNVPAENESGGVYLGTGLAGDATFTRQSHDCSGTWSEPQDGPVVHVVITPQNQAQYVATGHVLSQWATSGAGSVETPDEERLGLESQTTDVFKPRAGGVAGHERLAASQPGLFECIFKIDASELNPRIDALAYCAPDRMRVQMNFLVRDRDVLARAAYGSRTLPEMSAHGGKVTGLALGQEVVEEVAPEQGVVAAPPAKKAALASADDKSSVAAPGSAEQPPPEAAADGALAAREPRAPAPEAEPEGEAQEVKLHTGTQLAEGGARQKDTPDMEERGRRRAERGGGAGERGPQSEPARDAADELGICAARREIQGKVHYRIEEPASKQDVAGTQPGEPAPPGEDWSLPVEALRYFARLVFGKSTAESAGILARERIAETQPAAAPITLRVVLLPPPTTQPASRPAE